MSALLRSPAIPLVLLGIMLALMLGSSWSDSAIIDELAHIPAGYAYVYLRDYRLNPEHPPLVKALAALPLRFIPVHFPTDVKSWTDDINGQWVQGAIFLYEAGNNPDAVLRLMRIPGMLLAVLFGWLLWAWARREFGGRVALLTLFCYAFSPTFIAHARFVTTDLAAAFGFFIGIVAFLTFLRAPTVKHAVIAGLAFGIAELLKFSLILLLPLYGLLLIAWTASQVRLSWQERSRLLLRLAAKCLLVIAVGIVLISLAYAYAVASYPAERQYRDAEFILTSFRVRSWVDFDLWLIGHDLTRPLGQYLLGLIMVLQRAAGGNTQYFLGTLSAAGDMRYFPLLYLFKETTALHILSLIALGAAIQRVGAARKKSAAAVLGWIQSHFAVFAAMAFIAIYWSSSVTSTLNIGVRHVLPTFPFIYLLVSRQISIWLRPPGDEPTASWWERTTRATEAYLRSIPRYLIVALLLIWMAASTLAAYPSYLSYYNELAGGTDRGYLIGVDSNYDWGQDLKRLAAFAEARGIQRIAVDYFGGGNPGYELGERFEPWWSAKGYPPDGGWFAVSATFQMGAYGRPVKGFIRKPEDSYEWLKPFQPVARAGKSIFIYQLPHTRP